MDIDVPHSLGVAEAKRCIDAGLSKSQHHMPGGGTVDATWTTDARLGMKITAMGQTMPVQILVEDAMVRGTVSVPMVLKMMSGPILEFVKTRAQKMLPKPA